MRVFNLPRSFRKLICIFWLPLPPLTWQPARMFGRFVARDFSERGGANPARQAVLWHKILVREGQSSRFMDFCSLFEDALNPSEIVRLDPSNLSSEALESILSFHSRAHVTAIRASSSFYLPLFPSGSASPNFRRALGFLDYETMHLVILLFGNLWRWSVFCSPRCLCFSAPRTPNLNTSFYVPISVVPMLSSHSIGRHG